MSVDILLRDIVPDPKQPRRYFDPVELQELTDSVREKGVLQPIKVRPYGDNKYMIVFGEKRWRASNAVMALFSHRNTIPAIIQELNDDEALEEQVIENLLRRDMTPMEEGAAFKRMHDKRSVEEIGLRIGKSPAFVAQRLKLCDLIQEWQDLLAADKMKLGLAFKLARLPKNAQTEIYKEAKVPVDWSSRAEWKLPEWVNVNEEEHDLDEAPFDINDAGLYPEAGACATCQYNSQCSRLLFPELQLKPVCNNGVCYEIKSSRAYKQSVERAMTDPDVLFVSTQSYLDGDDKKKVAAVEELGVTVLDNEMIEVVEAPEKPPTWEEFLESEKEDYGYEEMDQTEQQEFEQQCKDEHDSLVTQYQEELEEFREAEKGGLLKKAFVVAGYGNEGTFTAVRIKAKKGIAATNAQAGANVDIIHLESEIAEIQKRERRNMEIAREKVYKKLLPLFKPGNNGFLSNDGRLTPEECCSFLVSLAENCHQVRDLLQSEFKIKNAWSGLDLFNAIQKGQTSGLLQRSIRHFIYNKLVSVNDCDYGKSAKPAAFYTIGQQYFSKELTQFEKDQNLTNANRQKKVNARLKALEDKKATLIAEKTEAAKHVNEPETEMAEA